MTDRTLIESMLQTFCAEGGPGLVAGVFRDGEIVDSFALGYADIPRKQKITVDTAFHVASISKQFTAFVIALLEDRGLISLDQSVASILTSLKIDPRITIRHLVHHTSGLLDQWNTLAIKGWCDGDPITTGDILRFVPLTRVQHEPGYKYLYCNTGYTLMGEIVKKITDLTLQQFLEREVFEPLKISRTRFREDYRITLPHEAACYRRLDGNFIRTDPPYRTTGASSLQTTLQDFARWTAYLHTGLTGSLRSRMHGKGELKDGTTIPYGFGRVLGTLADKQVLSHSGGDADFSAYALYLPDRKTGAAIFSNGTYYQLEALTIWVLSQYEEFGSEAESLIEQGLQSYTAIDRTIDQSEWKDIAAFGNLATGDLRLLQQREGRLKLGGTIGATLSHLHGSTYLGVGTLTAYEIDPAGTSLKINSTLSGVHAEFAPLSLGAKGDPVMHVGRYRGEELDDAHTIGIENGNLSWSPPRYSPQALRCAGDGVFTGNGCVLVFEGDRLTISNPRAQGFALTRIK